MSVPGVGTLPHSDEAERATVAGILLDNRQFQSIASIVSAGDFYGNRPRLVFQAEAYLIARGVVADTVTLRDRLEAQGKLAAAGGLAYIASLTDGTARSVNVEHYARIVRKKSAEREVLTAFEHLSKSLMSGHSPEDRLLALANCRELLDTNIGIIGGIETKDLAFELASAVLGREITKTPPIIEGFLWPGDIGLCSGAGGVGKTWLLQDLSIALASGRPAFGHLKVNASVRVAFLDLESRGWEIDERVNRLACDAGLTNLLLIRERLRLDRPDDVRRLRALIDREHLAFVVIDSLRRAIGGDLNRAEVANALFVDVFDPIRLETGCGFMLSAHTRKRTGDLDLDAPDQAMSGTVDLRNMSDLHVGIEARAGNLCIMPTKTRHGALPEPFLVALDGLSGDDDGPVSVRYVSAADKASDKVQDAIVALLDEAGADGALRGEIIGRAGYSVRAVDSALAALKRRDRIVAQKVGKQVRYTLRLQRSQTSASEFGGAG